MLEEASKIEEEDAEALLNDIDLDFESYFDSNLLLGRRKESSSQGATGLISSSQNALRIHKLSSSEDKRERENSSHGNLIGANSSHGGLFTPSNAGEALK
jgi:hypothetical protein